MLMKNFCHASALFLTLAIQAMPALAQQSPSYVRLRSLSAAGSGCPVGTVSERLSQTYDRLELLFDSFLAEVGPNVPLSEARKNCQINIDLDYPQGWSYAIASIEFRGYVNLEPNITAQLSSTYYYAGRTSQARLQTNLRGPTYQDFWLTDRFGIHSLEWSPCNVRRALNINTQIRLDNSANRRSTGLMTLDSMQSGASHRYGLMWRRC